MKISVSKENTNMEQDIENTFGVQYKNQNS